MTDQGSGSPNDEISNDVPGLHAHLESVARPWVETRHASPVIRGIFDGSLDPAVMRQWLEQDYFYLHAYARAFARLAALAPNHHFATLIDGAHYTVHSEFGHLRQLGKLFDADLSGQDPRAACSEYINYLYDNTATFEAGVVAVSPCMVGFAALGMSVDLPAEPRYRQWVQIYSASDFQGYSLRFAEVVDDLDIDRREAVTIFERGMELEFALWDDASKVAGRTLLK